MRKLLFAALVALLLVPLPVRAGVPVVTSPFTTAASGGTGTAFNPKGSSNCAILFTSVGGSTITVLGSVDGTTYQTNTNFGTNGVIAVPANGSVWVGSTQSFPGGMNISWSGNSGTLSGTITCFQQNGPPNPTAGVFTTLQVTGLTGAANAVCTTSTGVVIACSGIGLNVSHANVIVTTGHCILDTYVGNVGDSTTVAFTGGAAFATQLVSLSVIDTTAATIVPTTAFASISTTNFTASATGATNGHTYYYQACGF